MTRRRVVGVLAALGVVAALAWWLHEPAAVPASGAISAPLVESPLSRAPLDARETDASATPEVRRLADPRAPASGEVRIRVLSAQGTPIPSAAACEHRRSRWSSATETRTAHARADAEGVIRIAASRPLSEGLWVFAPSFVPRELGALAPGIEHEVRLEACAALEVRALTLDDEPLESVLICVARRALPHVESQFYERARAGEMRASLDPELAIHTALTDASGYARIEGLLPGEFHLRASHPAYVQVHEEGVERATVPGPEKRLRFARLAYDAVEVRGDRVLRSGWEFIAARPLLGTMQTQAFVSEIRRRMEARFPSAQCIALTDHGPADAPPQRAILDLWLERAGRWRVERPLRLLEGELRCEFLDAPQEGESEPRGELEVLVRDRLQRSIAVEYEVHATRRGEQVPTLGLRAMSGSVVPVPVGKGKLSYLRGAQPILLSQKIEIEPGQRVLVERSFDVALRTCELVVIPPYEDAFERGSVFVRAEKGLAGSLALLGSRPELRFLLPEGRSELRISVPGFEEENVVVEVPVSDELVDPPRRIEVALRPQA
ncbi:MAG: carboxypeptidase regulatory-like domain-containing protein [Planctomycetes bacterium]|nr:carboxypeptidase regulatory-like domain-containing protein [Planctomycetota bacterium]